MFVLCGLLGCAFGNLLSVIFIMAYRKYKKHKRFWSSKAFVCSNKDYAKIKPFLDYYAERRKV